MIRVKICGVTRVEDAVLAAELGASAIGMVFWPGSPRCIDPARAKAIVKALPPFVAAVGVFVNQIGEAFAIAGDVGLSAVQLHGDEAPDTYRACSHHVIKAIAVRDGSAAQAVAAVPDTADVLLDAHDAVKRGGTGQTIDWSLAAAIAGQRPVILSGGLNALNVVNAIEAVRPAAIDVSSGVESAPGTKDHARLRALFDTLLHSPLSAFDVRPSDFPRSPRSGFGETPPERVDRERDPRGGGRFQP